MDRLRNFLRHRPAFAALVVALALALRVLVPGGFMPVVVDGRIVMKVCNGVPGATGTMPMAMPGMQHHSGAAAMAMPGMQHHPGAAGMAMPGMQHHPGAAGMAMSAMDHSSDPSSLAMGKCAYADLAQVMTGGADPILLLAALAFALALALSIAITLPPREAARLRPPLRGPPATA